MSSPHLLSASIVVPPLPGPLTYLIPAELSSTVVIGSKVAVPLGSRTATGYVVKISDKEEDFGGGGKEFDLKSIEQVDPSGQCFNEEQLQFFYWVADYYADPPGRVIETAVPQAVPRKFSRTVRLAGSPEKEAKGRTQRAILSFLEQNGRCADYGRLLRLFKGASHSLKKLAEQGVIEISSSEMLDHHIETDLAPEWAKREILLNEAQEKAFEAVLRSWREKKFETFLLYGITGSGKTEVYIDIIREVKNAGYGALVIVPEIALTPQLVDRFRARLGNEIAVLHSAMTRRMRWDSWRALLEGRNQVAIGARSAIFAPVRNPGLIIVDEEHDGSFKQGENLRYNARDLAVLRGKLNNCPVVLGSATPSLESFHNAEQKKYTFLELPSRHSESLLPAVEVIDLNKIKPWEMPSKNISPQLEAAVKDALADDSQTFILYNRRGFATYLQCDQCGAVLECPNCSVTLTYHRRSNSLLCHYCSYSVLPPEHCSKCPETEGAGDSAGTFVQRGGGTEKVTEEIASLFPGVRVERLDRDAVEDLSHYKTILSKVRSGDTRILVGTQMIAKGHDLPNVTLVGIVDCDVGLNFPDFRCSERVFQLLIQASGRAGRGDKPGRVILQTRVPGHPSLVNTLRHDYAGFAGRELAARKGLRYPPFSKLLRVIAASQEQHLPPQILLRFKDVLSRFRDENHADISILGPAPAPIGKLKTLWRWHMLLKSGSPSVLNHCMKILNATKVNRRKARVILDMDPQDML